MSEPNTLDEARAQVSNAMAADQPVVVTEANPAPQDTPAPVLEPVDPKDLAPADLVVQVAQCLGELKAMTPPEGGDCIARMATLLAEVAARALVAKPPLANIGGRQ